jgi:hypothetical protein
VLALLYLHQNQVTRLLAQIARAQAAFRMGIEPSISKNSPKPRTTSLPPKLLIRRSFVMQR